MFEIGKRYHRRTEIHAQYGGQEQGGISTPRNHPYILLFSGDSGELYGYQDGWVDSDTFRYSGEGQRGDMQMLRGNLAIRDHVQNGKEIHLFQKVEKGVYRYEGELEYASHHIEERTYDLEGRSRQAIVFILKRLESRRDSRQRRSS